ncbi:MAG: transposase [Cyclobacteriaceae bacterium]|nr:transposase [Cyclobacteriaceae bacterium]
MYNAQKMDVNTYYHIYNRANGNENLFRSDENYEYFLKKWGEYISDIADTYAYCLMPNHFHFLIKTKTEIELKYLTT